MIIQYYDLSPAEPWVLSGVMEELEELVDETDGVWAAKWGDHHLDGVQLSVFLDMVEKEGLQAFHVREPNEPVESFFELYIAAKDKQALDKLCQRAVATAKEMADRGSELAKQR